MDERHKRQSFLGDRVQETVEAARVTIVGLCGGGSHIAQQLAHVGIGHFDLVDFDTADETNLNRMVGLTFSEAKREDRKVDVLLRLILAINPKANVVIHAARWEEVADQLKGSSAIFGCVDSYRVRDELERYARRYLIPYIDVGMDVHDVANGSYVVTGQIILSLPYQPCMRCFGFINEGRLAEEAQRYGDAGGKPQVVWPNGTLASTAVGKFMQLLFPWGPGIGPSLYTEYDGNRLTLRPSSKLAAIQGPCRHFDGADAVGDVVW